MRGPIYKPFFTEGISGDVGIVYHRTGTKALHKAYQILGIQQGSVSFATREEEIEAIVMPAIAKSGLIISPGMYGPPGVYNTYSIKSQLNGRMNHYGEFIVKSQTKLSHVLVFDQDQAKKMFGLKNWSVFDQLSLFGVPAQDLRALLTDKVFKDVLDKYYNGTYLSSEVALSLIRQGDFLSWVTKGIVKGIVYTGSSDGKCLLVYDHDLLIPKAYALSTSGTKLDTPWKSFEKLTAADYQAMKTKKQTIQAAKHKTTYDLNDPEIKKARQLVQAIDKGNAESILDMLEQKYISPFSYWEGQPFFFLMVERVDSEELFDYITKNYEFNANLKEKKTGSTAIDIAMNSNHAKTFKALLKVKNLSFNILNHAGWSVLHNSIVLAARDPGKYLAYFKDIVNDPRVNVNFPTKDRRTPLDLIREAQQVNPGNLNIINDMELMLKKKGAK